MNVNFLLFSHFFHLNLSQYILTPVEEIHSIEIINWNEINEKQSIIVVVQSF